MNKLDDAYVNLNIATKEYLYQLSIRQGDGRVADTALMIRARVTFDKAWDVLADLRPAIRDAPPGL